jgi:hypothetical protein
VQYVQCVIWLRDLEDSYLLQKPKEFHKMCITYEDSKKYEHFQFDLVPLHANLKQCSRDKRKKINKKQNKNKIKIK